MSTRKFATARGDTDFDVVGEAGNTVATAMEFKIDLTAGLSRAEVLSGLSRIYRSVLRGDFPPVSEPPLELPVTFDGTNDYLTRGSSLTGAVDSKYALVSYFWRQNGGAGSLQFLMTDALGRFTIRKNTNGTIRIILRSAAGGSFQADTALTPAIDGLWHHYLWAINMDHYTTTPVVLYINGNAQTLTVIDAAGSPFAIDFTDTDFAIGASVSGASKLNGDLAAVYVNTAQTLDITDQANRLLFLTSIGTPEILGDAGDIPTGTAPTIYLDGSPATFADNRGAGGRFTVHGALTDAVDLPVVVLNRAPTDIVLDHTTLNEQQLAATVGHVAIEDADAGDAHDVDVDDIRFEVVNHVLRLKAGQQVEMGIEPTIPLTLTATDQGGLQISRPFTITVIEEVFPGNLGVNFSGADYLLRGAPLTSPVDSKLGIIEFFWRIDGSDTARQTIFANASGRVVVQRRTDGTVRITLKNAAGSSYSADTFATFTAGAAWHHFLYAIDTNSFGTTPVKLYVDDVATALNVVDAMGSAILVDWTDTNWSVGALPDGTDKLTGDLAHLYVNSDEWLDITVEANRRKFLDEDGFPVYLGPNGTGPTTGVPVVNLTAGPAFFPTNRGYGGDFTVTGALTAPATIPFVIIAAPAGTIYLDSVAGNDTNDGLTTGTPVHTLARALGALAADGTLNIKCGSELIGERLDLRGKGAVTVQSYDSGAKPIIRATYSNVLGTAGDWTSIATNRWQRTYALPAGGYVNLVQDGKAWPYARTTAAVDAPGDWNTSAGKLTIYATSNPASYFSSLKATTDSFGTADTGAQTASGDIGVTISNLRVEGWRTNWFLGASADIMDCEAWFSGGVGFRLSGGGTYNVDSMIVRDCGSGIKQGTQCVVIGNSAATDDILGIAGDWTDLGGNVWSRSTAPLYSPPLAAQRRTLRITYAVGNDIADLETEALLADVDGPDKWFFSGDTTYVYSVGNPASTFLVLQTRVWNIITATFTDLDADNAGEDTYQHAEDCDRATSVTMIRPRLGRAWENAIDLKGGNLEIQDGWIWQFMQDSGSSLGPGVTGQLRFHEFVISNSCITAANGNKNVLLMQEYRTSIESERNFWVSRNGSATGVIASDTTGQLQQFLFDAFFDDCGASQGLTGRVFGGDWSFRHCAFRSNSSSSTERAMYFLGSGSLTPTSIVCDLDTTYDIAGTDYYRAAIVGLTSSNNPMTEGNWVQISGLTGASAAFNGVWQLAERGPAISFTRGWFYVPVASSPPATADLTGLVFRRFARLTALEANTISGKTDIWKMEVDVGTPGATFNVDFDTIVPNTLGANHFQSRTGTVTSGVELRKDDAARDYTGTQIVSEVAADGNLKFDTGGKIGGALNVTSVVSGGVDPDYDDRAITQMTVSNEIATVSCEGHGLAVDGKVYVTGATIDSVVPWLSQVAFVETVPDADHFTIKTPHYCPDGTATLTNAKAITMKLKSGSAAVGAAPTYTLPGGQLDLQGNLVPASGRSFGPVQSGA